MILKGCNGFGKIWSLQDAFACLLFQEFKRPRQMVIGVVGTGIMSRNIHCTRFGSILKIKAHMFPIANMTANVLGSAQTIAIDGRKWYAAKWSQTNGAYAFALDVLMVLGFCFDFDFDK